MIRREKDLFVLETQHTIYCFRVMHSGHLEHLYYGRKINLSGGYEPLIQKCKYIGGSQIAYSKEHPELGLEDVCLEMSSYGKGDIREAFIEITHEDGSSTCDFLFKEARLLINKEPLKTLPSAYQEKLLEDDFIDKQSDNQINNQNNNQNDNQNDNQNNNQNNSQNNNQNNSQINNQNDLNNFYRSLEVELFDKNYNITLLLTYSVFEECDVITRSAKLINTSDKQIKLDRIMSVQLDLDTDDYVISTFHGTWAREMKRFDTNAIPGIFVTDSKAGVSSNRSNPFFMVSDTKANEDIGDCYGFNLIYSGNHYGAMQVNSMGKLRIIQGIQPNNFRFLLKPQDEFEAPESVLTYSPRGFNGMSQNMHRFIHKHVVRGEWRDKVRPVLQNSWEANYFKFDEGKLLKQAKVAKETGIELFVLDDGWFGKRNDDTSSLGDWTENTKKLKGGLKNLADKINAMGLDFGIWVEPEMVNEDSDLYRLHPDWAVRLSGTEQSIGRNQLILDLTRDEVCSYIIQEMSRVFASANITYVKWDMNRIFSDCYSSELVPEQQKEFGHRYILGLYHILTTLTTHFPKILFESCASGGNRFDLGMLCYMPQTWASDNTDAICRAAIQTGYSYGYPMSVLGAHVSGCPNHQTLRNTSIDTRFEVAAFGLLGYECNLTELNAEEKKAVTEQIAFYKKHRKDLQFGDFYRIKTDEKGIYQWLTVALDKKAAFGLYLQKEVEPNFSYGKFQTKGLAENKLYQLSNRQHIFNIKEFGDLINMISPIHIKKDSLAHNIIAMVKKMPGEIENCRAYGDVFNHAGVKLKQGFGSTGYDEDIRLFQDYASRLYLWEEVGK